MTKMMTHSKIVDPLYILHENMRVLPTAICNVESTRSLDHGSFKATLSTVSTWMGDRYKRVNHTKRLAGAAVSPVLYRIVRKGSIFDASWRYALRVTLPLRGDP
jgi:hypothetical protein